MALALNNLKRVDMPLNKGTKSTELLNWINVYMFKWPLGDCLSKENNAS